LSILYLILLHLQSSLYTLAPPRAKVLLASRPASPHSIETPDNLETLIQNPAAVLEVASPTMLHVLVAAATAFSNPVQPSPHVPVAASTIGRIARVGTTKAVWVAPPQTMGERSSMRSSAITMYGGDPKDVYAVLGLRQGASSKEVKAAYRERAKKLHPDVNPTSAAAAEFRKLTEVRYPLRPRSCRTSPNRRLAHYIDISIPVWLGKPRHPPPPRLAHTAGI
jgi:hypothetical protein